MKRQRAFSATELLVAGSLLAFGVVTACGGGDDSSGGTDKGGAGGSVGGASGGKGGSAGKGGLGGKGNTAGDQSTGGDVGGDGSTDPGPIGAGGEGGAGGAVDTLLKQAVYPAAKFPAENPDLDAKDMLGKILFWDEQVGSDNTMACGTCHRTGAGGGSDPRAVSPAKWNPGDDGVMNTADDIHGSQGIKYCTGGDGTAVTYVAAPAPSPFGLNNQVTTRKAPTYLDAMFATDVFWDGRATSQFIDPVSKATAIAAGGALESQSVGPPMNAGEMACANRTWAGLLNKLATATPLNFAKDIPPSMKAAISAAGSSYKGLFAAAFPDSPENSQMTAVHFAFAIATHERHLRSDQTPWDRYNQFLNDSRTGDRNALTAAQVRGFQLFTGKAACNGCHTPPFFSDFQFHNLHFITEKDVGRQATPGHTSDPPSQVKTANLRNVGLREAEGLFHYGYGPGVSLDAVIAKYNAPPHVMTAMEVQQDPLLASIKQLALTPDEISDLLDFLRNGLTDPRVKNAEFPFDKPTLSTE